MHSDEAHCARKRSDALLSMSDCQGDETFLVRVKHLLSIFATCTLRGPDFGAQYNDVAQASHIAVRVRTKYHRSICQKRRSPSPALVVLAILHMSCAHAIAHVVRVSIADHLHLTPAEHTQGGIVGGGRPAMAQRLAQHEAILHWWTGRKAWS